MKSILVNSLLLVGTTLSLRGDQNFKEMSRPFLQDIFTTEVKISLTLLEIHFRDLKNMEVQLDFLLHQKWYDSRLDSDEQTRKRAVNGQIWRPKVTTIEGEGKENENAQFWRGTTPEGNILLSEKISLKTFCTTNFENFPFDEQYCYIKLGTYRFLKEEVQLIWDKNAIEKKFDDNLKEFHYENVEIRSQNDERPSGNFTILTARIALKRNYSSYIFCLFLPCSYFVCITYLVFWLYPTFILFRLSLTVTNLFALILMYLYSSLNLIYVSLKAIDIFISICIVFVMFALLENVVVDWIVRQDAQHNKDKDLEDGKDKEEGKWIKVDYYSVILYPILFVSTLLMYSMVYFS